MVLAWLGKALFVWPWVALWRYVVVPVVTYGLVVPGVWIYRQLLTPLGHGIAWLLTGIGHGIAAVCRGLWAVVAWLVVTLLVTPVVWVYRRILAPVGREIAAAVGVAWRIAGYISRAVGRALKWLAWNLVGRPVRWFYQGVCTPGRALCARRRVASGQKGGGRGGPGAWAPRSGRPGETVRGRRGGVAVAAGFPLAAPGGPPRRRSRGPGAGAPGTGGASGAYSG